MCFPLTDEDIRQINAARAAAERARDAQRYADYQRDCLASWQARDAEGKA